MGVDIGIHIEVRKDNEWQLFCWKTPRKLHKYNNEEDKDEPWELHDSLSLDRFYPYENMIEEAPSVSGGLPDDLSVQLKEMDFSGYLSTGSFLFSDLVQYCEQSKEKLLNDISRARDLQVLAQLDRIEAAVCEEKTKKRKSDGSREFSSLSIQWMFEMYEDDTFCVRRLRDTVFALMNGMSVSAKDIRLVYYLH